jgi:MoaA/NifB/PqqE/SkfB family radical SAM enzyme
MARPWRTPRPGSRRPALTRQTHLKVHESPGFGSGFSVDGRQEITEEGIGLRQTGVYSYWQSGAKMELKPKHKHILKTFLTGSIRFAEFAITNVCIAKCTFCDIWKQKPKVFVAKEKALLAIDKLADLGVAHITLTGGEPLMHPNIVDLVKKCTSRNIHNAVLDAAPSLITDKRLDLLDEAGNDMISISFDSDDPKVLEESRQIPHILRDMEDAVKRMKRTKIKSMASILIWNNNHDRMEKLFAKATDMGFDLISINYPTFSKSVIYPLGGEGISLSRELVIQSLENIIEIKRQKRYAIVNSRVSMENIIRYLKDPSTVRYECLGGSRVMFVDWFCDVRPCMQLPQVLGNILTMTKDDFATAACNKCNMSWYRDFSAFFHGVKSFPIYWESITSANSKGLY